MGKRRWRKEHAKDVGWRFHGWVKPLLLRWALDMTTRTVSPRKASQVTSGFVGFWNGRGSTRCLRSACRGSRANTRRHWYRASKSHRRAPGTSGGNTEATESVSKAEAFTTFTSAACKTPLASVMSALSAASCEESLQRNCSAPTWGSDKRLLAVWAWSGTLAFKSGDAAHAACGVWLQELGTPRLLVQGAHEV